MAAELTYFRILDEGHWEDSFLWDMMRRALLGPAPERIAIVTAVEVSPEHVEFWEEDSDSNLDGDVQFWQEVTGKLTEYEDADDTEPSQYRRARRWRWLPPMRIRRRRRTG
jgi:hypothetical protein